MGSAGRCCVAAASFLKLWGGTEADCGGSALRTGTAGPPVRTNASVPTFFVAVLEQPVAAVPTYGAAAASRPVARVIDSAARVSVARISAWRSCSWWSVASSLCSLADRVLAGGIEAAYGSSSSAGWFASVCSSASAGGCTAASPLGRTNASAPTRGVFGDFFYCVSGVDVELYAAGVFHRDVQGAKDQFGALEVDGVAHECVDDFHQRGLDGLFVLEDGDGVKARLRRCCGRRGARAGGSSRTALREERGAAADSGDFDMSAGCCVGIEILFR